MALKGTLKDFGIADIFQLIGHQTKTGILHLKNKDEHISIYFKDGAVIRVQKKDREQKDLIGQRLLRGEAITKDELIRALSIQKENKGSILGDILVEHTSLDKETLDIFGRLQVNETLFKVFMWTGGVYEFEGRAVEDTDHIFAPIKAEAILMDGFRMSDDWPKIQQVISSFSLTFAILKPIEEQDAAENDQASDELDDFESAFDDFGEVDSTQSKTLTENEKRIYSLITPDRTVQKIIDLSRIGVFETCDSLKSLLEKEYIAIAAEKENTDYGFDFLEHSKSSRDSVSKIISQIVMYILLVGILLVAVKLTSINFASVFTITKFQNYNETILEQKIANVQEEILLQYLEAFYLLYGFYPKNLKQLYESGIVSKHVIGRHWEGQYLYLRKSSIPKTEWLQTVPKKPISLYRSF